MNRKISFLLAAIFITVLSSVLIVASEDRFNNSLACARLTEFEGEEYQRVVSKKYIDKENHQFRAVDFAEGESIVLARDTSSFYDFVQLKDSIVKRKGADTLSVYRTGSIYKFKIFFGCPDR